jgi:hypothetical protein
MTAPACGFLREQGEPPTLARCDEPATCMALVSELGEYVPACDECAQGRQTKRPGEG